MQAANLEQGSVDWRLARVGMITASRIVDVMSYRKDKKESADRYKYKIEVVTERLTGIPVDHYETPEMRWGTEQEPKARASYEALNEVMTDQVGFIVHPDMPFAGASPDSLVGDDGGLEIKGPNTTTHIKWWEEYIKFGIVPPEHQDQCLFGMACAGTKRLWWDFVSYDPRLKDPSQKRFTARLPRDNERIAKIEAEVRKFNQEIIDLINSLPAAA